MALTLRLKLNTNKVPRPEHSVYNPEIIVISRFLIKGMQTLLTEVNALDETETHLNREKSEPRE